MTDNIIIVYDRFETDFTHYGLAVIQHAIDPGPCIKQRLNSDYTCTFSLPYEDDAMTYVKEENIVKLNGQLFVIRTVEEIRQLSGELLADVFAEHISSELVSEYVPSIALTSVSAQSCLDALLTGTRFTGSAAGLSGSHDFTVERKTVTWGLNHLIELTDGELLRDNFTVKLLPQIGTDNGVWMSYRKNLKTIKRTKDSRSVITRLYVYGKDGLSIPPIDSPHINDYPRPKCGEVTFDDIEDTEELQRQGEAYLATVDTPLVSYDADVVELKSAEGYDDSEAFVLGDTVHVDDEDLGIEVTARIIEYEEYPWCPDQSRVTLANFLPDLNDTLAGLHDTRNIVQQVTRGGKLNTFWLDGIIDALKNQIKASGAYANAQVLDNQGFLFENTDQNSPDYGALYIGPGWLMIADRKTVAGEWDWRTFGTGSGFTADMINAGILNTALVKVMSGSGNTVIDGDTITSTRADKKSQTVVSASTGIKVRKNTGTTEVPVWQDRLYTGEDGELYVTGVYAGNVSTDQLIAGTAKIGSALIESIKASQIDVTGGKITAGQIDATSLQVAAANITGQLTASQINAAGLKVAAADITGQLSASQIKTNELYVGTGGIRIDSTASLSWGQITNRPDIPYVPGYIQSTYIDSVEIRSPTIRGGKIESDTTISVGTDANVGNNLSVGQKIHLRGSDYGNGIDWGDSNYEIYTDPSAGSIRLKSPSGIYANGYRIDQAPVAKFA